MVVPVTSQNQVTISQRVGDRHGIETGSAVAFRTVEDGRGILIDPGAAPVASRFERLRGRAGDGLSTDQIMKLTRGEE